MTPICFYNAFEFIVVLHDVIIGTIMYATSIRAAVAVWHIAPIDAEQHRCGAQYRCVSHVRGWASCAGVQDDNSSTDG